MFQYQTKRMLAKKDKQNNLKLQMDNTVCF